MCIIVVIGRLLYRMLYYHQARLCDSYVITRLEACIARSESGVLPRVHSPCSNPPNNPGTSRRSPSLLLVTTNNTWLDGRRCSPSGGDNYLVVDATIVMFADAIIFIACSCHACHPSPSSSLFSFPSVSLNIG